MIRGVALKELPRRRESRKGGREVVNWMVEGDAKREVLEGKREDIDWVVEK